MLFKKKNISSLHVPHNKNTASCAPLQISAPKEVVIPMNMQSGHDAEPVVAVGDHVYLGQLIAREEGRNSSPIHASVSGTVKEIAPIKLAGGKNVVAITIENDGKMEADPEMKAPTVTNLDEFLDAVRASGVLGLGGAAFPVWAKLDAVRRNEIETILVNGAECEPYITSDHRMMVDYSDLVAKGVKLMQEHMNVPKIVIAIENNKQDAIDKLGEIFKNDPGVEIYPLETVYPQGAKQVLLYNVTGKVVKGGQRMAALGVLIINVSSVAKLAQYIETGMPLVDRIVTVDGTAVKEPKNLLVPIGTPVSHLLSEVEMKSEPGKILIGGPMLGHAITELDDPVIKATNAILAFEEKDSVELEPTACIRCGRCMANCPVGLNIVGVARAMNIKDEDARAERLTQLGLKQCIECACCSYVCPAQRPVLSKNLEAKRFLKAYNAAKKEEGGK